MTGASLMSYRAAPLMYWVIVQALSEDNCLNLTLKSARPSKDSVTDCPLVVQVME